MDVDNQDLAGTGPDNEPLGADPLENPTLDADDRSSESHGGTDGSPSGTDGPPSGTTDTALAALTSEVETLKNRYGGAVREMQNQKKRADELDARFNKYIDAGLDFSEIDSYINDSNTGGGAAADMKQYVSADKFNQTVAEFQYSMVKNDFIGRNPEFKDPDMATDLDITARGLAIAEMQTQGSLTTPVDQILASAAKHVKAKVNKWVEKGKQTVSEKRKKIKETAVGEGDTRKRIEAPGDEDTDPRVSYVQARNNSLEKLRNPTV